MIRLNDNKGFKLVELIIVLAILSILMSGIYMVLAAGRSSWAVAETQIQLQGNLRQTIERMSKELHESGKDKNGAVQLTINNGGGVNSTDIIKFSVPIICQSDVSVIDVNGDVAYWGAPLTWGCTSSSCMDADNSCAAIDYKYLEYKIDANRQLLRRVLDASNGQVRQDILAYNLTDLQASLSADQNVLTLTVTALATSVTGRQVTTTNSVEIYLRNKG